MKNWMRQFFARSSAAGRGLSNQPTELSVTRIGSYIEYLRHIESSGEIAALHQQFEQRVLRNAASFQISGYCYACRKKTDFNVKNEGFVNGKQVAAPNWRETLSCSCKLINRLRASLHLFDTQCTPTQRDRIYLTEQTTPIFNWLTDRFPNVTGSEYLGDTVPFGTKSPNGIRNESLTRLSFADGSFDHILSFDVFEHIPDYGRAFAECFRVLAPCGNLLFSVPFIPSNEETLVRARVTLDGGIEHLLPAEYHGDPMSADGCLCFYHFGWDMLANLKLAGFDDATALLYWSDHFGYLGGEQILFLARKG